ncbi:MAG: hypothetical protein ACETWT_11925 [Thermodesulfobacteriota bacterium]
MQVRGNVLVGESGGPTAVIDASLYGLVNEAKNHREIEDIFGALHGIDGILRERIIEHSELCVGLRGLLLVDAVPVLDRITLMTWM